MLKGEMIFSDDSTVMYTHAEKAGGTKGVFTVDVTQCIGTSPVITVTVQTKKVEDTWASPTEIAFAAINAVGEFVKSGDLLEDVRVQIAFTATGDDGIARVEILPVQYSS